MSFEILFFDSIDSTHTYLINMLKKNNINKKIAIYSAKQTSGIGSRGNVWESNEGNLYLSFSLLIDDLPSDLKLNSSSIYFAYLAKLAFAKFDKQSWVKWPNDLYKDDKKLGGVMVSKIKDMIICGIGINFKNPPSNAYGYGDIDIDEFLNTYLEIVEKKISWKDIFQEYIKEFENSRKFYFNLGDKRVSLENAFLYQDGSILLENQRIYSLR